MIKANKMPRPIRISRKLKLSSEQLVIVAGATPIADPHNRTLRKTGCPVHTC